MAQLLSRMLICCFLLIVQQMCKYESNQFDKYYGILIFDASMIQFNFSSSLNTR